jgi:hypothetical protein
MGVSPGRGGRSSDRADSYAPTGATGLSRRGWVPGLGSCEKINNLTQRRQGAKTRKEQLLCFLCAFYDFAPLLKCFCSSRDYFTASQPWVQKALLFAGAPAGRKKVCWLRPVSNLLSPRSGLDRLHEVAGFCSSGLAPWVSSAARCVGHLKPSVGLSNTYFHVVHPSNFAMKRASCLPGDSARAGLAL